MSTKPIGIFDSGVGGTSIYRELHALLPYENTIYLSDSKHAPYGPKGKEKIIELCIKNTDYLLSKHCKLIIVACNTATTNAIKELRELYNVPFIGIEPAIKPAALNTKTNAIGILATKGTLSSELFNKTSRTFAKDVKVIEQIGEGIVELIENGKLHSDELKTLLKIYLEPMVKNKIDHLVLGCTHYPYLIPILIELLPKNVKIIDSGEAVAKQTQAVLELHKILNATTKTSSNKFYSNGNPEVLEQLLDRNSSIEFLDF